MANQPETHSEYKFLKVSTDDELIYEALEGGHLMDFLELIRDHPEVVKPVVRVILHTEYDSANKSGAQMFIEEYDVQIGKGTGALGANGSSFRACGAFDFVAESEGANVGTAGGYNSTSSPASSAVPAYFDPFQCVAENFAAACGLAQIEKGGDLESQIYLYLLADLLPVGLPNLGTLVMPKAYVDTFDIAPLRALGMVIPY